MRTNVLHKVLHKIAILLALVFITGAFAVRADASVIIQRPLYIGLTDGLVGNWTFNGPDMNATQALDSSGQGNHGKLEVDPERVAGKIGQALFFDGSSASDDDAVRVPDANSLDFGTGAFTLAGWIKLPSGAATDRTILSKVRASVDVTGFNLWLDSDTQPGGIEMNMFDGASSATRGAVTSLIDLRDNTWHHFVFTRTGNDRTNWRIYIDGSQSPVTEGGIDLGSGGNVSNATALRIAARTKGGSDEPTNNLQGSLDEVRIYNRALSPTEIKRLHNIGSGAKMGVTRTIIEDGLVGHWSFDGPVTGPTWTDDISGNGNHGTLQNGPRAVYGKNGQALDFDGDDDYVRVNDSNSLDIVQFSVSHWVRGAVPGGVDSTIRQTFSKGNLNYMFAWTHTDNALDKACLVNDGTLKSSGSAVETLEADTWYHIACVKDSANLILYVNGKESARSSVGTPVTSSQMLTLGSGNDGQIGANPENFFDGLIDDVRIHNRALTADEIKRLYVGTKESYFNVTNSPGTLSDGLVGHWSFDGPVTGPTWTDDVSGNGNRGTLQNGPKAVRGLLGQALEFDGTDDYVQRNSAVVTGAPFSVCAWVKLDQLPTTRGDSSTIFSIGTTGNSSNWFNLRADGSDGTNTVQFNARDGNPAQIAQTSTTVTPGVWQHYCGVATSATDRKVYLNAGNVGANTTSVTPSGLNKTAIGVLDVGGLTLAFTDGLIDDVRVYNRALSEDEIKRLYNPKQ